MTDMILKLLWAAFGMSLTLTAVSAGLFAWHAWHARRHSRTISRGIARLKDEGVYPQEPSETAYDTAYEKYIGASR